MLNQHKGKYARCNHEHEAYGANGKIVLKETCIQLTFKEIIKSNKDNTSEDWHHN